MGPRSTVILSNALLSLFIVREVILTTSLCSGLEVWMHQSTYIVCILFTQFILNSYSNAQWGSRSKHYMNTFIQLYFPAIKVLVKPVY